MKTVHIDDQDYQAIAARYGSFERFIKQAARDAEKTPVTGKARSFYEAAAKEGGLLDGGSEYPSDLSTNPAHMEGFGQ